MLKLKYLFHDENLAEMLVKNWEYDPESLDMFQYYRISSNAIYPFEYEEQTRLLRFAPTTEKCKTNIAAELEFIAYLRGNGYRALEPVASLGGEELVEARTPWGDFYASVFKRVPGVQISQTDCNDEIMFCYGKALGKLHQLSSEYVPVTSKRWTCHDVLDWIEELFIDSPQEEAALAEARLLRNYFASLPVTKSNFGLVHYDFEYDNVFYDETTHSCHVIDFDDAMYHWYAMDIEQALASLRDCVSPDSFNATKQCFLDGYRTEFDISDDMEALLPACRRFAALYGYARVWRAMAEQWANEPDWLVELREDLRGHLTEDSSCFGKEI